MAREWRPLTLWSRDRKQNNEQRRVCESATAIEVFSRCPELLSQVGAFAVDTEDREGTLAFYRTLRCWSPGFRDLLAEVPSFCDPRFEPTVESCRALQKSSRSRARRLLLCAAWLLVIGVVCPLASTVWAIQDSTPKSQGPPAYWGRREWLFAAACSSLLLALAMPLPQASTPEEASALPGDSSVDGGNSRYDATSRVALLTPAPEDQATSTSRSPAANIVASSSSSSSSSSPSTSIASPSSPQRPSPSPGSLQGAIELMALRRTEREEQDRREITNGGYWAARDYQRRSEEDGLEAAREAIPVSREFLQSVKRGLIACSLMGLLITLKPIVGSCLACFGVFVGLLPNAKLAGFDIKLSVSRMFRPSRPSMDLLGVDGGAFLAEHLREEQQQALDQLPEGSRLMAVRALTSACLMVCGLRSLAVWVSTIHGCGQAQRDVHDVVCLPSLVGMMCPGFVAVGAVLRFALAWQGCCYQGSAGDLFLPTEQRQQQPQRICYRLAWCYLTGPLVLLNGLGLWVVLKLLSDLGHSKLSGVFSLWRVPAWEEVLVLLSIFALWLALILFGTIVPACLRILNDDGAPAFFGIFGAGYLLFEVFMALVIFSHGGSSFLPELMMITTSISTSVLALGCVVYMLYLATTFAGLAPRQGILAGYAFLWG